MEGAAAGRIKETERDRRLICAERKHERERGIRKGETSKTGEQKVQIHRARAADVSNLSGTPASTTV